ncbi:MAG: DVU0772 family protein [Nitrospirota bacterium]
MFGGLDTLNGIKRNKGIIKNILWDIEPKQLMEPCKATSDGKLTRKVISGFIFYIDMATKKPALFLMCHTVSSYGETVAKIDEIPEEMLVKAVTENKDKECFRMYPISEEIKGWLKKQLGVEG